MKPRTKQISDQFLFLLNKGRCLLMLSSLNGIWLQRPEKCVQNIYTCLRLLVFWWEQLLEALKTLGAKLLFTYKTKQVTSSSVLCLFSSGHMVPILLDCCLFEGHFNAKFEVTEELASTKCSAWKYYRWEYFQRYWEKSDAVQFQVESATICL